MNVLNQQVHLPILKEKNITLFIKREDKIHPFISGNKYRKLKYNLLDAKHKGQDTLLTFGGAYSNHIAATAYAGKEYKLNTIGVIRGEEIAKKWQDNPTLFFAAENGMRFKFVSRTAYKEKETDSFLKELENEFGTFYALPEGGANTLGIKGCEEILTQEDSSFNYVCSSVGTGGTVSGIVNASSASQKIIGFSALKGDFLKDEIRKFASKENWELQTNYHFGGYAKVSSELVAFINDFKLKTTIPLDPIYTGKMLYGILDLVAKDYFKPKTKILAIHSGGLQGITGINNILRKKELPLINI